MSMDKSAIQEINGTAIAATDAFNKAIERTPEGTIPAVALPKDFQLLDLERYLPSRVRIRGSFKTSQIAEFAEFCQSPSPFPVFVNEAAMSATAILNIGTHEAPGHCDHTAQLTLLKTAPYNALLRINGQNINQRTLAEWLEDWRDNITCHEILDGPTINIATAIASVRKMTVASQAEKSSTVGNFSSEKSDFEKIEAKAEALPSFIAFKCEPYQSLQQREFILRVAVHTDPNAVGFTLRIIKQEQHEQEMAGDLATEIKTALNEKNATVHVGTYTI